MIIELPDDLFDDEEKENTPNRFAQFLEEWKRDREYEKFTVFDNPGYDEMVLEKNIPMESICSHHLLSFFGKAHVAYIPDKKVFGLSKLARIVDMYAHRPQLQERLTVQIADFIEQKTQPLGVAVVIEAEHLCVGVRGVKKHGVITTTSALRGVFKDQLSTRQEFFSLIKG